MSYVPPHKRNVSLAQNDFPALGGRELPVRAGGGSTYVSKANVPIHTETTHVEKKAVSSVSIESGFRKFAKEVPRAKTEVDESKETVGETSDDSWITKESKSSKKTKAIESDWAEFSDY